MKFLGLVVGVVLSGSVCFAEEPSGLLFPETEENLVWEAGEVRQCDFAERYCELADGRRLELGERIALNVVLEGELQPGAKIEFVAEGGKIEGIKAPQQEVAPKGAEDGVGAIISLVVLVGVIGIWIRFYKRSQVR